LIENRVEGGKLGCEAVFEDVNVGIGGIQLRCEMFDEDMCLIDGILEILVAIGGHLERGCVGKETMGGWDHKNKTYK
jgi:hypothetical protein